MDYCDKIDICVKVLEGYLQRCSDKDAQQKNLFDEKEGWVEVQMVRWAAEEIKASYDFDVWDTDSYFMIDVMAILISKFSSQRVGVS